MQIIRPWLLIGKYRETTDDDLLARAGVGALLHLAAQVEPPGVTALSLPVEDGEPLDGTTLRRGVDFILAVLDQNERPCYDSRTRLCQISPLIWQTGIADRIATGTSASATRPG